MPTATMVGDAQPYDGERLSPNGNGSMNGEEVLPRTRVDSGHVIDGDGVLRRVPKLAVRNKVSDENNESEQMSTANLNLGSENERSAPGSLHSSRGTRTPMSNRSRSDESVTQSRWSTTQRQSGDLSKAAKDFSQPSPKKKRGGMLSFLTLKEPSTSAWADFADAEREKAKQKGSSAIGSGAHKPSSKRLPDFVPKVNSKWDGLPENVHRKSSDSKTNRRQNRNSVASTTTRDTTWTAYSTVSGDSKMEKQAVTTLSGQPTGDSTLSAAGRPIYSSDSGKQPPALALEEAVDNQDENLPQTFLRDPSPPPQSRYISDADTPLSPPELEGDEMMFPQELAASGPNSPTTPPADGSEARPALVGIHYPELDSIQKEAELFDDRNKQAVVRANSSKRPTNFSRPQLKIRKSPALAIPTDTTQERSASRLSQADGPVLSPTLNEPFLTDTFALHSRETGHIPQRVASTLYKVPKQPDRELEEEPISPISPLELEPFQPSGIPDLTTRPPTATSIDATVQQGEKSDLRSESQLSLVNSIAPSEVSEQWHMSPKERLGLGSKIRKSERGGVLPWGAEDDFADDAGISARDLLSPSPVPESRMKRLSWRLSVKK